jgi:hypothetical protein
MTQELRQPYNGTGTEVVDGLTANTDIPASRLTAVADWHSQPSKRARRHSSIAFVLREVVKLIANDNRVQP